MNAGGPRASASNEPSVRDAELREVACEIGTPLYVYDLGRLRARIADLHAALRPSGAQLYFATMANDRGPVLRVLAEGGVGACVNSLPHLELARTAGFPLQALQFTSTGITRDDMRVLQELRVRTNLDSLGQIETWCALAGPGAEFGLRLNAASLTGVGAGDRIGVDAADLDTVLRAARDLGGAVTGAHCYVGTNFQRAEEMLPTLAAFFAAAGAIPALRYVNIGGGIGIDYEHRGPGFDLRHFGTALASYADDLRRCLQRQVRVVCEPGRALTADCATFVTRVTDIKLLHGQRYVNVDASVALFPRPLLHPQTPHRIRQLPNPSSAACAEVGPAIVVGRTTFSRDILGRAALPSALRPDDLLLFDDAGAYCQSMTLRFLGQPDAHEVFIDKQISRGGPARTRSREDSQMLVRRPAPAGRADARHERLS